MTRLRFLGGGATHALVRAVASERGIEAEGSFGPVGAIRDQFVSGAPCDVVLLTHALIGELTASGHVLADPCSDLGAVRTALAVRLNTPPPAITDEESLRSALLAAEELYCPDPATATAGIHFAKVLTTLGIMDEVAPRLRTFPGGLPAMKALAASTGNGIGCTQATEILAVPGVALAAALPPGHELSTVYTAAIARGTERPEAAREIVSRLTGRKSAALRSRIGFEGDAIRRARREDESEVRDLVFGILREYGLTPEPGGTDRDLKDLEASYFSRRGNFDVAHDEAGRLVACCGVYARADGHCELRKMYVRSDVRRTGLGRRLLERAIAFARSAGYTRVELETASVLKEAALLYESAGFMRLDRGPLTPRCDRAYALELPASAPTS